MKSNVDGAWDSESLHSGMGVIIRDMNYSVLEGCSLQGSHNSTIEVEAAAIVKDLEIDR